MHGKDLDLEKTQDIYQPKKDTKTMLTAENTLERDCDRTEYPSRIDQD